MVRNSLLTEYMMMTMMIEIFNCSHDAYSCLGLFAPWTIRTDCSYLGRFVRWTIRTWDYSYDGLLYDGLFVPFVKYSHNVNCWCEVVPPGAHPVRNAGTFVPKNFRSRERKFHRIELSLPGTFVPWNFRSLERKFHGTFVPWNFRSLP